MLDINTSYILETEAKILLGRALLNKQVNAFGIDGMGEHGTSYQAKQYTVKSIIVTMDMYSTINDPFVFVDVELDGYSSQDHGHVSTDNNLRISINEKLSEHSIDANCWEYGSIHNQKTNKVSLYVNLGKLLEW